MIPMEVQRVARELTTTLMQRSVHSQINPRMRPPVRGYLVGGVVPELFVSNGPLSPHRSLYEAACGFVEEYWLRASVIPGKRLFELRYTPLGAWLGVVEHCNSLKLAVETARLNKVDHVYDVANNRRIGLQSLLGVPALR